jgi:hypothetical protein
MAERQPIPPEQMGIVRKAADRMVGVGNAVDMVTIGVGVLMLSAPVVAYGALSLMAGNYVRENYIRKK